MDVTDDDVSTSLAKIVRDTYKRAHEYRQSSGEYERMHNVVKQVEGKPLDCAPQPDGMPNLTINISKAISRGVVSMIKRPFSKTNNKPFVIKPTPKAELSEADKQMVAQELERGLQELELMATDAPELLEEAVFQLKEATELKEEKIALSSAAKMEAKLSDRVGEAGISKAIDAFIDTLSRFPFAVLKLEHQTTQKMRWNGTTVDISTALTPKIVNLNPFDFYPAPYARSIKDGSPTIERRRILKNHLYDMRNTDGYVKAQIDMVLENYPSGLEEPLESITYEYGDKEKGSYGFYDALIMWGYIDGQTCLDLGLKVLDTDRNEIMADEKQAYPVELVTIGNYTIRAVINEHPMQHNPYFMTSYSINTDNVYGDSPVTDLYTVQRVCNSIMTSLVRNLTLSSGVITEVNTNMLNVGVDEDVDQYLATPVNQTIPVKASVGMGHAYHFHTIPNLTGQLMSLLTAFTQYCYEILGVPRVAFGQTEGIGTVGRTSAGVAMVMKQASGTIYDTLTNIETNIIAPLIQEFLLDELLNGDDPTIKGDVQVYAVGLSGILEKESQSDKLNWLLQSLTSIMQILDENGKPIIPPEAPARVLFTMFKEAGIPTAGLFPDFGLEDALRKGVTSSTSPVSIAPTDGRTGALQAGVINEGIV